MSVLPKPDEIALAHSKKLRELLTARIESDGPISFARYMEQALYAVSYTHLTLPTKA